MNKLKGTKECPTCHAIVDEEDAFWPKCGTEVPDVEVCDCDDCGDCSETCESAESCECAKEDGEEESCGCGCCDEAAKEDKEPCGCCNGQEEDR